MLAVRQSGDRGCYGVRGRRPLSSRGQQHMTNITTRVCPSCPADGWPSVSRSLLRSQVIGPQSQGTETAPAPCAWQPQPASPARAPRRAKLASQNYGSAIGAHRQRIAAPARSPGNIPNLRLPFKLVGVENSTAKLRERMRLCFLRQSCTSPIANRLRPARSERSRCSSPRGVPGRTPKMRLARAPRVVCA